MPGSDPAIVAVLTAILSDADVEAVLAHVLSQQGEPVADFAFRDRSRVKKAARIAAAMLQPVRAITGQGTGPASHWVRRTSPARQAAFVLASARRLAAQGRKPDLKAERRYMGQHLAAERARFEAAARVDRDSATLGPLLGWYAKQDEITDPICRALHGSNFRAALPPLVEGWPAYPGTLHGGACRCVAGAPFPRGPLLAVV